MSQLIPSNDNPSRPDEVEGDPFALADRSRGVSRKSWRWAVCDHLAEIAHQLVQTKIPSGEDGSHLVRLTNFLSCVDQELDRKHRAARFSPADLSDVIAAVRYTIESVARCDLIPDLYRKWLTWANTKRAYENPSARLIRAVWELIEHAAGAKPRIG